MRLPRAAVWYALSRGAEIDLARPMCYPSHGDGLGVEGSSPERG